MLDLSGNKIQFDFSKCQQCGCCEAVCPTAAITFSARRDGLANVEIDHHACIRCRKCVRVCPSNMEDDLHDYFERLSRKKYYLGHNSNPDIRRASSSGGVARTLIVQSLEQGLVDGVYALKKRDTYPFAEGEFYTRDNMPANESIPNSVYHSVMLNREIHKIKKCERLLVVGTNCQLKSLKAAIKGRYEELIEVCIFCKQQKTLDSTRFLAKMMGTSISRDNRFFAQYRGDGWPGIVKIADRQLAWERAATIPFGRRLWSVPGCNICGDPFGADHADISLMDPWHIHRTNELGSTLVTAYTDAGKTLLERTGDLQLDAQEYQSILPALDLQDIRRKQQLVPYFKGDKCTGRIKAAGRAERFQRWCLRNTVGLLPRMPILFYRVLGRVPDLRNIILK